jgi:diphosphomevalonate decarboxylase
MTGPKTATARSHSNIAFIKYWGNRNAGLRLPENGSISMNLAGVDTVTTVRFDESLPADRLILNNSPKHDNTLTRASHHLDNIRRIAGVELRAEVRSQNNFPTGTGIASSASAFAALTLAGCSALGLDLDEPVISALARLGSGSACRSVPGGYVEWYAGYNHDSSYAKSIAPASHWELIDLVAIVSREHKAVGSTGGHALAPTSPLQAARVADAERRLDQCRRAILERDFDSLAQVVEHDALIMHAVMMTSLPALIYWQPPTLRIVEAVRGWRADGIPACFTIDAGPNVHVITPAPYRERLSQALREIEGVQDVLTAKPGGPSVLLTEHLVG